MRTRLLLVLPVVGLAVVAMAQPDEKPTTDDKPGTEAARRAVAVATFEGGRVTVGDLEDAIAEQSAFMRKRYAQPEQMQKLLEKNVRLSLLAREAEQKGFADSPAVVQSVKQNAVQALMKAEFDDKITAESISADAVAQYYQDNLDEFVRPAMKRASYILLKTEGEARALLAEAKRADMRQFRQLARSKSIDAETKMRGGDLRYFDAKGRIRGQEDKRIPGEIARAAFKLKNVGDTAAQPLAIEGGFAIVKLTGQRAASSRSIAEAEETIRMRLWRQQRQSAIDTFLADLRTRYKPEMHPELIDAIKFEAAAPVAKGKGKGIPDGFPADRPASP